MFTSDLCVLACEGNMRGTPFKEHDDVIISFRKYLPLIVSWIFHIHVLEYLKMKNKVLVRALISQLCVLFPGCIYHHIELFLLVVKLSAAQCESPPIASLNSACYNGVQC